ncbi:hypothetical protein BX600DRAFT_436736 [Xylariales sp. PMI_506]|nr:hypothetical protein BX600DRAFT_436736 [Xylariales sp. PMI_506]
MTAEENKPAGPQTPHRKSPNATPNRKATAPGGVATPKSAPAAITTRQRPTTANKAQATLLGDFLLGRQTPARVAADRAKWKQKQMSLEQVKQEMRESAVRRVQAPGGVHDRVKQWQKKNATAMTSADPFATPSEPSEVHIQVDDESVTEEDRVRIKKGIKKKPSPKVIVVERSASGDGDQEDQEESRSGSPPKKRVVSDTNWMKNKRRSPPRNSPPKAKPENTGSPIPKDFLSRSANPTVKNKIKDWAARVELPEEPQVQRYSVGRSVTDGDGIRIKAMAAEDNASSARSSDRSTIIVETAKARKPKANDDDDGIRVTPNRKRPSGDDGIRVKPKKLDPSDDGIRVYSTTSKGNDDASTARAPSRQGSARAASFRQDPSPSDRIEVIEEPESDEPETPTRRSRRKKSSRLTVQSTAKSDGDTVTALTEDVSDSESWTGSDSSGDDSDRPSSLPSKLEEIPVGYSAFSELNLPVRGSQRRPKAKRNPSFKGATNVLKKAFVESKKMISEKVDPPPKPVANQPRSIESWLNKTVDPFVEKSSISASDPKRKSIEKEWKQESKARRSSVSDVKPESSEVEPQSELTASSQSEETVLTKDSGTEITESTEAKPEKPEVNEKDEETTPTSSAGLRRSRAIRSTSSPLKPTIKKGFKERLKEAFRGESSMNYRNNIEEIEDHDEHDDHRELRRSSGSTSDPSSLDDESSISPKQDRFALPTAYPKRQPPPTNGMHELSTILSLGSLSTSESELSSVLSDTTITQTTSFTKSTGSELSRHRSNKPGLKRRLTKHSDLVSVLSLPDEGDKVHRSGSIRSAHSIRRSSSHLESATVDGLLKEFARDEDLYQRELKTLVDGVIPVLLTQVVHGNGPLREDLFSSPSGKQQDNLSRSVVQMGVALEKLKNAHKRCPMSDAHRLPQWLETTYIIYDNYLDVWRLGFNDLIVNLAPLALDDNDSLINALPRNEQGDVLNEDGERADVAHLLKRPLVRIKWVNRFIKGYRTVTGTDQHKELAIKWEKLQEKARRRYKEENARAVDEDAINTDTSRVRDLRTLEALDNVRIDRFRQVYAKDLFSLDLQHSNGQRLECRVELISRDNQVFKSDLGDLLIRETGSGGRSWLLFAPILGGQYSARKGDNPGELVVMIRGKHDEWFQLLTLTTDNEEQVLDWIDILGTSPEPPSISKAETREPRSSEPQQPNSSEDAPLGERRRRSDIATVQSPARGDWSPEVQPKTPIRQHSRTASGPAATRPIPSSPLSPSDKTPTQGSYSKSGPRNRSVTLTSTKDDYQTTPLREHMRPDPVALSNPPPDSCPAPEPDDETPPPPPAHRTLPSKNSSNLSPPLELTPAKIKRRTSSPLKHEYHPSDVSSEGSTSGSESDNSHNYESDSSDDELEAADIPDTTPGISIKKGHEVTAESIISASTDSLTPSASASQAGLPRFTNREPPAYAHQSLASISYWDGKKGCWKNLWPEVCSIITTPGLIEAYAIKPGQPIKEDDRPLIALDLTPLVMLRNSTALDLEIRSPVLSYARLYSRVTKVETCVFRFRSGTVQECEDMYMAVHQARMDNAKFKALEEEARVRAFGQNQASEEAEANPQRRSWFGRKNSYRASARAPSQSAGSTSHASSVSASSFLKRLMGGGNTSFDIAMSSVDKQSRGGSREPSLYASSSSAFTTPRSPSVSAANSDMVNMTLTTNNLKIRLHLMVSASKWEDHGNCLLEITRPPSGTRQNLRKYQGMEKRVIVTSIPRKSILGDNKNRVPIIVLDVVLGSRCFSRLGSRGILLNVWEEVKDEAGETGMVGQAGTSGGMVNKWCFQCANAAQASWIFGLVTQEVVIA